MAHLQKYLALKSRCGNFHLRVTAFFGIHSEVEQLFQTQSLITKETCSCDLVRQIGWSYGHYCYVVSTLTFSRFFDKVTSLKEHVAVLMYM